MAATGNRLALIVNSASYERVSYALDVAVAAAALGREVSALFGHGGILRLRKGETDRIGEETTAWLRERVKLAVEKGTIPPLSESLGLLKRMGGKVYACPTAMEIQGFIKTDLIEGVDEVRSLVRFIQEDAAGASLVYV